MANWTVFVDSFMLRLLLEVGFYSRPAKSEFFLGWKYYWIVVLNVHEEFGHEFQSLFFLDSKLVKSVNLLSKSTSCVSIPAEKHLVNWNIYEKYKGMQRTQMEFQTKIGRALSRSELALICSIFEHCQAK